MPIPQVFSNIKFKSTILDGPKHLFDEVRLARELFDGSGKDIEYEAVKHSIQLNSSMGHPESILLAMCGKKFFYKLLKLLINFPVDKRMI